jgi:hypothetical protein
VVEVAVALTYKTVVVVGRELSLLVTQGHKKRLAEM